MNPRWNPHRMKFSLCAAVLLTAGVPAIGSPIPPKTPTSSVSTKDTESVSPTVAVPPDLASSSVMPDYLLSGPAGPVSRRGPVPIHPTELAAISPRQMLIERSASAPDVAPPPPSRLPEPTSIVLVLTGLVGITARRRMQRARAESV